MAAAKKYEFTGETMELAEQPFVRLSMRSSTETPPASNFAISAINKGIRLGSLGCSLAKRCGIVTV